MRLGIEMRAQLGVREVGVEIGGCSWCGLLAGEGFVLGGICVGCIYIVGIIFILAAHGVDQAADLEDRVRFHEHTHIISSLYMHIITTRTETKHKDPTGKITSIQQKKKIGICIYAPPRSSSIITPLSLFPFPCFPHPAPPISQYLPAPAPAQYPPTSKTHPHPSPQSPRSSWHQ